MRRLAESAHIAVIVAPTVCLSAGRYSAAISKRHAVAAIVVIVSAQPSPVTEAERACRVPRRVSAKQPLFDLPHECLTSAVFNLRRAAIAWIVMVDCRRQPGSRHGSMAWLPAPARQNCFRR